MKGRKKWDIPFSLEHSQSDLWLKPDPWLRYKDLKRPSVLPLPAGEFSRVKGQ